MTIRAASKTSGGFPPANCRTTTGTRTHPQAQRDALRGLLEQGGVGKASKEPSSARASPVFAHVGSGYPSRPVPAHQRREAPRGVSWAIRWAATVTPR
jgi:hypothetical protein